MRRPHQEKTTGLEEAIERPTGAVKPAPVGEEYDDEAKSTLPLDIERGMEPQQSMNKVQRRTADNSTKKDMQKKRKSIH